MTANWVVGEAALDDLDRIASYLSLSLAPGDLVALSGELGAGKTAFARLLIRHVTGTHEDIPSPTFALAQSYESGRLPVTHFDCYRLSGPDEAEELGLDDALRHGAALLEWPEKIESLLPGDRLDVSIGDGERETTRTVTLAARGTWGPRLARVQALYEFVEGAGWGNASVSFFQGDASTRTYARLAGEARKAVLMDSPPMPDGPPIRDGKAYSAIAHLAEDVKPFVTIAGALRDAGLSAPEIHAADLTQGFLIVEDLGARVFGAEIAAGAEAEKLYRAAVGVLVALRNVAVPDSVPPFDVPALEIETELLLDWFWPAARNEPAPQAARNEFTRLWQPLFDRLSEQPAGWVLRDYHSPNLIWLPEREGIARVGIIDFQDAMRGSFAYDLVSLAQDARRDVSETLEGQLLDFYCRQVGEADTSFQPDLFRTAYATLGAQRNTKILGIFARLAARDGKEGYLRHTPRVSAYLERNLVHPDLAALRGWFDTHLPASARLQVAGS